MKELTNEDWSELDLTRPTLVKFWAAWCGPCKMFAPRYERIAGENSDFEFYAAELEPNIDVAKRYGVRSIPTVLYLHEVPGEFSIRKIMTPKEMEDYINGGRPSPTS